MIHPETTQEQPRTPDDGVGIDKVHAQAYEAAALGEATPGPGAQPWLLAGLKAQETFLQATVVFFQSSSGQQTLSRAAEWMLDNFYLARQSLRQIREDMPPGFYRQLPKLSAGPLAGYPRIYDVAQQLVADSGAQLDMELVQRFVLLYQDVRPLTTGELWALPVMLRLSILAALAQAAAQITNLTQQGEPPSRPLSGSLTGDEIVANCFTSLRTIGTYDWPHFFESVSRVEQILREDPAAVYAGMDRATRDRYRHVVEQLALATGRSELEVARTANVLAQAAWTNPPPALGPVDDKDQSDAAVWPGLDMPPPAHVGFYLLDDGRRALEDRLGYRPSPGVRLARLARRHPAVVYLGSIAALTLLMTMAAVVYTTAQGGSTLLALLAGVLVFLPALAASVALVDWVVTMVVPPRILPKLNLSGQQGNRGIPDSCRTLVAMPAMLTGAQEIASLVQQIEQHYLRNPDHNLYFALLTDFGDAREQHLPGDEALLEQARAGIGVLNERYAGESGAPGGPFCMFHRERRWNEQEGRWIGWERKRGKLHELNRWLRGATDTSISSSIGQVEQLRMVRYVITLDADTILGRDSARRLIATLAHPLNRAQADSRTGRVVHGYGLLQPRTEIIPASANYSRFSRIFAGDIGLDLYTHAMSNVYQDLFGSGSYIGKGIYDVDAFENSLAGRVPENVLLSHDLFEGIHARAGLVTDIALYEDYPPSYLAYMRRQRRWTRGDWQLLPWLLPRAPGFGASRPQITAGFGVIDNWKLLDNLRRSLLPPALLLLLIAGWLGLPGAAWVWTAVALLALAIPALIGTVTPLATGRAGMRWQQSRRSLKEGGLRWLLAVVFLPFEAAQMLGAIATTLDRLLITHRHLLEWMTAAKAAQRDSKGGRRWPTWKEMLSAPLTALMLALLLLSLQPGHFLLALPLLLAWALSPEIAYRISQPIRYNPTPLTAEQVVALRSLARRTWLFFEDFVGPNDHWLPPDHYQESPRGTVATYTSPTNIGLLLLSTLAAYDLGYIGITSLVSRLRSTFESLERLERFRGHLLNWYDTRTLEPMLPRYVSTVDSGNFAACLRILGQACQQIPSTPMPRWQRWEGVADTFALLDDFARDLETAKNILAAGELRALAKELRERVLSVKDDPYAWMRALSYVAGEGWQRMELLLTRLVEENAATLSTTALGDLRIAVGRINNQLFTFQRFIDMLFPGLLLFDRPPQLFGNSITPVELGESYRALVDALPAKQTLEQMPERCATARAALAQLQEMLDRLPAASTGVPQLDEARTWCRTFDKKLAAAQILAQDLLSGLQQIDHLAEAYFSEMDFGFVFEPQRQVFHIGYNVADGKLDGNFYDLLASEARIASLVALAKHEVPRSHWLHLARPITRAGGTRALLSWSATMFEYLMPTLFMRSYAGTLLHESAAAAVDLQIAYGRHKGVPWGISESGYYAFDPNMNYQYQAFGVPGLGFKRNLAEDLVITPYASLLALPFAPHAVADNLERLVELGALGVYGLYEAVDFTPAHLPLGKDRGLVQEYMAHHQGMILVALDNYLSTLPLAQNGVQDGVMVQRFHSDPRLQSVDLLLQERVPADVPLEFPRLGDLAPTRRAAPPVIALPWEVPAEGAPMPHVHYLSNGQYSLLITASGGGVSRWGDLDLTRWRADTTLDDWGTWLYVQDRDSGALWSAAYQPVKVAPTARDVRFYAHKAEFRRTDHEIALTMEIAVAPDDDVEIRRVTLHNQSERPRRLALTSYGEVVMAAPLADQRHPAFNKLFIESEYLPELDALLFRRRPRAENEAPVFLAHLTLGAGDKQTLAGGQQKERTTRSSTYESDRMRFLGSGHAAARAPKALLPGPDQEAAGGLSGTVGATLDPIMCLQREIDLQPGETVQLAFLTLAADSRAKLLDVARRFQSLPAIEHAIGQARSRAELELRQASLSTVDLERIQTLLSALLYPQPGLRAAPATLAANTRGQPALWAYGISGDYPILLVRIATEESMQVIQEMLQAHAYWRQRGLKVDLVILNQFQSGYNQDLRDQIHRLLALEHSEIWLNQHGGIFILNADQLNDSDRILLETAARVAVDADQTGLAAQLDALRRQPEPLPPFAPERPIVAEDEEPLQPVARPAGLAFDNGLGGFSSDGREYVIYLDPGQPPPAPWLNVVANPEFGFLVSESGSGTTWALNSGENRLTPWSNDPVTDRPGEALYLRDEETAEVWSPTPQPCGASAPYLVRHGAGYTVFEHHSHALRQRLRLFVPPDAPVKIIQLRLENATQRPRRITATFYAEWVLGVTRAVGAQFIIPEFDDASQALLARNPWHPEFGGRVAFAAASKRLHGLTADRSEFLGRLGSLSHPAALGRIGLGSTVQAGLDPCAALQMHIDLPPGGSEEVWFLLGQGVDRTEAVALAKRFQDSAQVEQAWQATNDLWDNLLGAVQVHTPDPAMDLMLNRWLLYQSLGCRIWGRSALYQSSGAFGFRDQLQDVMALIHAAPELARRHILTAAGRQFEAGDVLHWWHPPSGRGVRTRCSDDLLWLPYVTTHYVDATGDESILDEQGPFIQAAPLGASEEDRYGEYSATDGTASLYEHCRRAIERGTTSGDHGLPLIGSGDWNDGLNRVGAEGRGESVWLGWFLHANLSRFAVLCERRGDVGQAATYRQRAETLRQALERSGWDGDWYLRAFYDDGSPLGSSQDAECQIDSIAQSWAVLSRAGEPGRATQAMDAVQRRLVRTQDNLALLFTPPFDKTPRDPGYVKGYLPGIRENGGQYTHAALWSAWAFAELGQSERAENLFRLLNPIYHADTPAKVERYKVEPYVVAADVYSVAPHTGRGGWTWYTGSAAWMYRLGLEGILGLHRAGAGLIIEPHIPAGWPGYEVTYRYGQATYAICVQNDGLSGGEASLDMTVDGLSVPGNRLALLDDGELHQVQITLKHEIS
jgi:cyclic beta-1,2-glucan synthetase